MRETHTSIRILLRNARSPRHPLDAARCDGGMAPPPLKRKARTMTVLASKKDGNKLILTIELAATPFRSKSAIAKALKAGQTEDSVEATMLATSGGFTRVDGVKLSYNVTK
jgi:hypothetical protein